MKKNDGFYGCVAVMLFGLLAAGAAVAAPPQIASLTAAQRAGTKLLDISYTLACETPSCAVSVRISTNNGVTYGLIPTAVTGNGQGFGVTPGSGKTIVWDAGTDWDGTFSTQLWIEVTAFGSSSNTLTFTENARVCLEREQGDVWCQPVWDGTCVVASAEGSAANITARKYDTNLNAAGAYAIVASTNDTGGQNIADHKHIFQNNYHYLVFSISGSGDGGYLYLTKFDRDFNRIGIVQVVSNEPPTNDMLLFGDGEFVYAGKFCPEEQAAHKIYKYDGDLNLIGTFLEGTGSNSHANADAAMYLDGQFYFVSPQYVGPNANDKYYRIAYDTNFNVTLSREIILQDDGKLGTINGLSYYNGRFIIHYCKGSNEANPIARAVYDAGTWDLIQNEVVFTGGWHASHTVIVGDTMYMGCTYETGGAPPFSNVLAKFTLTDNRAASPVATGTEVYGPMTLDTRGAPAAPASVSASSGSFTDKVRVTWNASSGATSYQVWRHTTNDSSAAELLGNVPASVSASAVGLSRARDDHGSAPVSPASASAISAFSFQVSGFSYSDSTTASETTYYYWIKAVSVAGTSTFSSVAAGYPGVVGPLIAVNGLIGDNVRIAAGTPLTIAVEMMNLPAAYIGHNVDWWVAALMHNGNLWFYLNNAMVFVPFDGDLANMQPAYQGQLADLPPYVVARDITLAPGTYNVWFAVDYPMDGVLHLTPGQYLMSRVTLVVE